LPDIALTFDDGPHPRWTRQIVGSLGERSIKATFFIWGEQAAQHGDVVREVLDAGHSVQPHCWRHKSHRDMTVHEIEDDVTQVVSLLGDLGAPRPHLWRPPWGQLSAGATRSIAKRLGLALVGWTIDTRDWSGKPASEMIEVVRAGCESGGTEPLVVLMHESSLEHKQAQYRSGCEETVGLVRRLVRDEGFSCAPLTAGLDAALWTPRRRWYSSLHYKRDRRRVYGRG
jgi:peptidoglycan/xylan/chitin deacetylase (PgdA/CDA1 family)